MCVHVSAVEIQTIGPILMTFGPVEDHDPGMFFVYVLLKIRPRVDLLRLENLSWPNCVLDKKFGKTKVGGHTQQWRGGGE